MSASRKKAPVQPNSREFVVTTSRNTGDEVVRDVIAEHGYVVLESPTGTKLRISWAPIFNSFSLESADGKLLDLLPTRYGTGSVLVRTLDPAQLERPPGWVAEDPKPTPRRRGSPRARRTGGKR